jgi:hypothetical protein
MVEKTLLIDTDPDEERVFRALVDGFATLREHSGLTLVVDGSEQVEEGVVTTWFVSAPEEVVDVTVTVDAQIPAVYTLIRAIEPAVAEEVAASIAERLPTLAPERLRAQLDEPQADLGRDLQRLAILVGSGWRASDVELVRRGLESSSPTVRADTAMAIGISPDPRFAPLVRRAAKTEDDLEVGRLLGYLRQLLDSMDPPDPGS